CRLSRRAVIRRSAGHRRRLGAPARRRGDPPSGRNHAARRRGALAVLPAEPGSASMSSLPQRPDKTIDVSTAILIRCRRDEVAEFAADPDNAPQWHLNIKSVEWKSRKSLASGARIA